MANFLKSCAPTPCIMPAPNCTMRPTGSATPVNLTSVVPSSFLMTRPTSSIVAEPEPPTSFHLPVTVTTRFSLSTSAISMAPL